MLEYDYSDAELLAIFLRIGVAGKSAVELAREQVEALLRDGFAPSDIAIVSLRGQTNPGSLFHLGKLGRHTLVHADDPQMSDHIVADTFLRFKGLERPAVLVTDLRMPQIDGITLARLARTHSPTLPILIVTAYPDLARRFDTRWGRHVGRQCGLGEVASDYEFESALERRLLAGERPPRLINPEVWPEFEKRRKRILG